MKHIALISAVAATVVASSAVAQWNQLSPTTAPSPRTEPAMAYDMQRGETVLFGGGSLFSFHNDTWTFDGDSWTQRTPATVPGGRAECPMVFDSVRGNVLMYGGNIGGGPWGGPASDELWSWNGQDWTLLQPAATPGGLARYGAAFDSTRGRLVVYGGVTDTSNLWAETNTWEFNGTTWTQVATAVNPGPRENPTMCYDVARQRTVLFGGIDPQVGGFADTWAFDGTNWARLTTNGTPGVRTGADMVFDPFRGVCVLHGGMDPNNGSAMTDTWEFDGTNWTMVSSGAPSGRTQVAIAYDAARRNIVMFGGIDSSWSMLDETWEFGASFHGYGSGCGGSLAAPTISNRTGPAIGAPFQVDLGGLDPASSAAFLVFGFTPTSTDLAPIGMTGCTLYASSHLIFGLSAAGGAASWTINVPSSSSLMGARFYCQGMGQDATANATGLVLSPAGAAVIGL